jgi:hypothetical protein
MPTTHSLVVDATTATNAAALVTPVAAAVAAYAAAHPEAPPITADINYVYSNAVHLGLNYWRPIELWPPAEMLLAAQPPDIPTISTFTPAGGVGNTTVSVSIADADVATAVAIIAALASVPNIDAVLGAAVNTGVSILMGSPTLRGPFS